MSAATISIAQTQEQLNRARELLSTHRAVLETVAEALIKEETLDSEQVEAIFRGEPYTPTGGSNGGSSGSGSGNTGAVTPPADSTDQAATLLN